MASYNIVLKEKCPQYFFVGDMTFDNYKEYLQYTYNSSHASGKIVEIIEMVKTQPRHVPFDFEFNTVEGTNINLETCYKILI